MKKFISDVSIVLLLAQIFSVSAIASGGVPAGNCVPGLDLQEFMEHSGEHMHNHIGVDQDLNGDGFICMKMLSPTLHLHLDNTFPLE